MNLRRALKYVGLAATLLVSILLYLEYKKCVSLDRFRSTHENITSSEVDLTGLKELNISGSKRVSIYALKNAFQNVNMPVYIFDLQKENHYFIEGINGRFYGFKYNEDLGVNVDTVGARHYLRRFILTGSFSFIPESTQTEEEIVDKLGYHYVGMHQSRGRIQAGEKIDAFLNAYNSLPQNVWVHFHCDAGCSRTTISMVLVDIIRNGKNVALKDIVARQYLLGGVDLFDTEIWKNGSYTKEQLEIRKNFIENFYEYATSSEGYGYIGWEEWAKTHCPDYIIS